MDISNVCRTCLRVPKAPHNLFKNNYDLLSKIESIASVVIEENQELPSQICEECYENINSFYDFRKVIIATDCELKSKLKTLKAIDYAHKARSKMKSPLVKLEPEELLHNFKSEDECKKELKEEKDIHGGKFDVIQDLKCKLFQCSECKEWFDSKLKLNNHKRSKHSLPGVCNICGTVVRSDNLSKHLKVHSDNPVKCKECGRLFKNSESLRTHRFVHSNKSFTCHLCGRMFKLKGEHTRHLKVHADPDYRKSACPLCGKKVHEMKKHLQTHTGQKPFICNTCHKGFSSPYALKVHGRQHTNERPYICDYCGYSFLQRVSLRSLLLSKHGLLSSDSL